MWEHRKSQLIIVFEFLSSSFPIHKIDSYHDGQKLSSAYKYFTTGSLWSGSYITVGVFYEILSPSFMWSLFDNVSIGLARFAQILYVFIFKIFFIYFIYLLTNISELELKKKIVFFLFNDEKNTMKVK